MISNFKRTKQFQKEDFEILTNFLDRFQGIQTTPNILTEVSNLSTQLPEKVREDFFKTFVDRISLLDEKYYESKILFDRPFFASYGLTDAVIIELAKGNCLVLTSDFPLSNYLLNLKLPVINYNHLRGYWWSL